MLIVLGSINVDLVTKMKIAPSAGETLFADSFAIYPGGKGANQAVAASKLGVPVRFWGMVGDDGQASIMLNSLKSSGVDISSIETAANEATGSAIICVEAGGQNRIIVVRGANFALDESYIERHRHELSPGDILLCQNEMPQNVILAAFKAAKEIGATTIYNPAPAVEASPEILKLTDIIIPNQSEARALTGLDCRDAESAAQAAAKLREQGPGTVIITLGEMGLCLHDGGEPEFLKAHKVTAIDTTAAGDSFVGGLCSGLISGKSLAEAAEVGQLSAAYSVRLPGAQPSMATLEQLESFAEELVGATTALNHA